MPARALLLHSSGLSGRQWRRLEGGLKERGFATLAPDFIGHGAAERWPEPRPFSFRQDVSAITTELRGGAPSHVIGHSYGGLVGLLAALAAPESVRSLTLFEPVAFGVLDPVADADAFAELSRVDHDWGATEQDHDRWLSMFVDYWGGQGAWEALREEARAEFRRGGWAVREGVRTLVEDRTPAEAYRALRVPTRLVTGERSPLAARRVVQRLSENLADARVVVIPGAGHMAPLTHGELVHRVVYEALGSASESR